jgi:hypothetical protein
MILARKSPSLYTVFLSDEINMGHQILGKPEILKYHKYVCSRPTTKSLNILEYLRHIIKEEV